MGGSITPVATEPCSSSTRTKTTAHRPAALYRAQETGVDVRNIHLSRLLAPERGADGVATGCLFARFSVEMCRHNALFSPLFCTPMVSRLVQSVLRFDLYPPRMINRCDWHRR